MNDICICAIARNENKYLDEWIVHYLNIGFDNIVIFDNNDEEGENILDITKKYKNVEVDLRYRGKNDKFYQKDAYTNFYKENLGKYEWIAFFDIDEILILEKETNIKDFLHLEMFNNSDCIRFCWKTYTDNNLITVADNIYSNFRFTEYSTLWSRYCKSIIKGNLNYINSISAHGSYEVKFPVNCIGQKTDIKNICIMEKSCLENAWLNHYRYRTIEEFVDTKSKNWNQKKKQKS